MDEYDLINKSSLKYKGEKRKRKLRKSHNERSPEGAGSSSKSKDDRTEDAESHGGWWPVSKYEHIRGDVAIEFLPGCYARALGNGKIVVGGPHPPGEGPDEEEIFTAICAATNQISLKTGFGRYLNIDKKQRLMGLAEVIGEPETFLPTFEDNKMALCAYNDCFLGPDTRSESRQIEAKSSTAGPNEMLTIRVSHDPAMFEGKTASSDEVGKSYEAELGHLKRLQSKGIDKLALEADKKVLKKAKAEGHFYEALLETRVKHKSDKYCK